MTQNPSPGLPPGGLAEPPPGYVRGESRVPGIEVYLPARSIGKQPETVSFTCPRCGGTTAYRVETGALTCEYCGYSETPEQKVLGRSAEAFEFKVDTLERSERGWGEERRELACQNCGGVVSTPPGTLSITCPFCGSNKVLFREPAEDVLRPRYLIPFQVDSQACQQITRKWLGGSWMVPKELRGSLLDKFNPLYIPYWTFNAACSAAWKAEVAHTKTEHYMENGVMKERQTIEWRPESGKVQKTFSNLLVPGTTRLHMRELGRVDSFNISALTLYEPRYLAGMHAQSYDLPLEDAWAVGRQLMRESIRKACLDRASGTQVRNLSVSLDFNEESWRYILVPLYTSVYRFQERPYQILINGQNGKIAGPRPVDWRKVWLVIAALVAPGLLTGLIGLLSASSQAGSITVGVGLFLLVLGLIISVFLFVQGKEMERV